MQLIPAKSDSTAGSTGQLPAAEYNDRNVEIEKVITKSGQTLSAGITDQFSKAIFINAIGAASMIDSGSGNTITLNPVTGGSGLVPPDDYADFNGGVVCFNKATVNTGTAVTIAPWGLTAKALVRKDGSLPLAGDVIGECFVKWDNGADKWLLMRNETDTYKYLISASGAVAPKFANNEIEIDLSGGNISISTLPVPDFVGQRIDFVGVGTGICDIAAGTGLGSISFESDSGIISIIAISSTEWRYINLSVGKAQLWQDVSGSRVKNVTYTNNTGRPIEVYISASNTSASQEIGLTIDGSILLKSSSTGGANLLVNITAIIPNGSTYILNPVAGAIGSIGTWAELR